MRLLASRIVPITLAVSAFTSPQVGAQEISPVWFQDVGGGPPWFSAENPLVPTENGGAWMILTTAQGTFALKYSRSGDRTAQVSIPHLLVDTYFAPDGANGFYRAYNYHFFGPYPPSLGGQDILIERFDATGHLLWGTRIGDVGDEGIRGVDAIDGGGLALAGFTSVVGDFGGPSTTGLAAGLVATVDSTGTLIWATRVEPGPGGSNPEWVGFYGVAADETGRLFAHGEVRENTGLPRVGAVAVRLEPGGDIDWFSRIIPSIPSSSGSNYTSRIAADEAGGAVVLFRETSFVNGTRTEGFLPIDANGAVLAPSVSPSYPTGNGLCRLPNGDFVADIRLSAAAPSGASVARPGLATASTGAPVVLRRILGSDPHAYSALALEVGPDGSLWAAGHRSLDGSSAQVDTWIARYDLEPIGAATGCSPAPNSTGETADLLLSGEDRVSAGDLHLFATGLPLQTMTVFLASRNMGSTTIPGTNGVLCLAGSIGRFVGPGKVRTSDRFGYVDLPIDPLNLPNGPGLVSALAGETWFFQAWFRDNDPAPTSNLTSAVRLQFQ